MKKQILTLIAAATTMACFAQITLGDAYSILAELPALKSASAKNTEVVNNAKVSNVKEAAVQNYKGAQNLRNEFFYMVESLPMRDMLVGANNGRELKYVYAQPCGNDCYNLLLLNGDEDNGNYSVCYGQTNGAGVQAIRDSRVTMCGGEIAITDAPSQEAAPLEFADNV